MQARSFVAFLISTSILSAGAWAQTQPAAPTNAAAVVTREMNDLSSADFAKREEALSHLQTLVAQQLKQRAQIQDILNALQADLEAQQHALALVTDEEAQAQIAGLLEMERGLTSWTIQSMSEPADRRKALLDWGLTNDVGPTLAKVYALNLRVRLAGIAQLAKLKGDGADWTLGQLINDREGGVRTAAMAVCWSRTPSPAIVDALWYRAVSGPLALGEAGPRPDSMEARIMLDMQGIAADANTIKVEFPGGDPMEFDDSNDAGEFFDAELAADVLVHMNTPLVGEKVKTLVAQRLKTGKTLSLNSDPDWTLVAHQLVETYKVKEAIPVLAREALGADTDDMDGEFNGRPFSWSRRSMAIGALAQFMGKDAADFSLFRARDPGDPRGWMWAVEVTRQQQANGTGEGDGPAVRAFYAFWKDHHAEYGVTDAPLADNVPKPGQSPNNNPPGRFRGRPIPADGPMPLTPDGPVTAPAQPDGPAVPEGTPAAPPQPGPLMRGGAAG